MPTTVDMTNDPDVWDNTESVTFYARGASNLPYEIDDRALVRAPNRRELAVSNGVYTGQDLVVLIPAKLLQLEPGQGETLREPRPGDKITRDADDVQYTVLERKLIASRSVWWMMTRNLALAYDLSDTIDIQRPTITYDVTNAPIRHWPSGNVTGVSVGGTTPYSLAAKVQKLTDDLQRVLGVEGFRGSFAVTVASDVHIESEDRVKWLDTTVSPSVTRYLDIKGQHNPQRIDELPVLDCELVP